LESTIEIPAPASAEDDAPEAVTVVLAEQDQASRLALRLALERQGFSVVAEAADGDEALAAVFHYQPQVCVLELELPGGGVHTIEQISTEQPGTRIATLTDAAGSHDALRAIRAGADGYLLASTAPDRLSRALKAMLRGETVIPRAVTTQLVSELRDPVVRPARRRGPLWVLLYIPRFLRHFRRRLRSRMKVAVAWESTRERMQAYR
jgi:DNA-binding NarL/FixJ family response regulator